MTNEELKEKLLDTEPVTTWWAGNLPRWPRNPEGVPAFARIEELEAENARFKAALEEIAEEIITDASPEYDMWHTARDALKGTNDAR